MNRPNKFALIDYNNFYASCERLFRPDLREVLSPKILIFARIADFLGISDNAQLPVEAF